MLCRNSLYPTKDGWIALACSSEKMFQRLADIMGRPELATGSEYGTMQARIARRDEVNALVAAWSSSLTTAEAIAACDAGEMPCGPLNSIADIFRDPQYAARENMARVSSRAGDIVIPTALPKMSDTPPSFSHAGPALGEHTDEVLRTLLGMDEEAITELRANSTI